MTNAILNAPELLALIIAASLVLALGIQELWRVYTTPKVPESSPLHDCEKSLDELRRDHHALVRDLAGERAAREKADARIAKLEGGRP